MALNNYGDEHRSYSSSFRPELHVTEELGEELTNRYQQLSGVMSWSIELGRIYILMKVICLSQHLCSAREGHIGVVYFILRYLQKNWGRNQGRVAYEPIYKQTDEMLRRYS